MNTAETWGPEAGDCSFAPLSFAQQRLWVLDQLAPAAQAYNVRQVLRITGSLDVSALRRSLDEIVRRHEILRTTFDVVDDEPVQIIRGAGGVALTILDYSHLANPEGEVRRYVALETARGFDLKTGPLLRASLVRLGAQDHVLAFVLHHIVTDEWAMGVFNRELSTLYEHYHAGAPYGLAELAIQYADFAAWQRSLLAGDELTRQLTYWRQQLAGAPPAVELPTDRARSAEQDFAGASEFLTIPSDVADGIAALGRANGATLFMTLLAAFNVLLYRYSGQRDLVVGSPIANRTRAELQPLIGFFVNTLALRTRLDGRMRFADVLQDVRTAALRAYDHQDLPFEKLVAELHPERSLGGQPVTNVLFALQTAREEALQLAGLRGRPFPIENTTSKVDVVLRVTERPGGLGCSLLYATSLFDAPRIRLMLEHFSNLLRAIVAAPQAPICELPMLSAAERERQLVEWNATKTPYPAGDTVHELFERQARRTPEAVAVAHAGETYTYRELDERADALASELRAQGFGSGDVVGICTERSRGMVAAALAVLKTGAAYLPLDPEYPGERLRYMLDDAGVRIVLAQHRLTSRLRTERPALALVDLDAPRTARASADAGDRSESGASGGTGGAGDAAYIMYTSGSTGQPKGVIVAHRGIVRLVSNTDYVRIEPSDVVAQVSTFSFDAVTFEMWGALLNGARLEIIDRAITLAPEEFATSLRARGISIMFLTTALFRQMVRQAPGAFSGLRYLVTGGEVLDTATAEAVLSCAPPRRFLNAYGPTEVTTFSTTFEVRDVRAEGVPIGRPIANTEAYVLDADFNLVPAGVPGQLYLGGPGLAIGYLNDAELTARKFVPHPFSRERGARLYATGDRVRHLPDGTLEFVSRMDGQVKIRGYRIETGEIEAALRRLPDVRDAAVVARESAPGDKALVAYVVDDARPVRSEERFRRLLARELPRYMVPSRIVIVPELALSANGKIDSAKLPDPRDPDVAGPEVRFTNPLHYQILMLWEDVLRIRGIGIRDNFFEIGGHSLLAAQLMSKVATAFDSAVSIRDFIADPTIRGLAEAILERRERAGSALQSVAPGGIGTPFFLLHGDLSGGGYYVRKIAPHVPAELPFYALAPHGTDGAPFSPTIEAMAREYIDAIRRERPHGPYMLGGFCSGGLVAFEIARQLCSQGETVSRLVLMDCAGVNGRIGRVADVLATIGSWLRISEERRVALSGTIGRFRSRLRQMRRRLRHARVLLRAKGPRHAVRLLQARVTKRRGVVTQVPGLEEAWRRITASYIPRRYPGSLTLLLPSKDGTYRESASTRGWRRVAAQVDIHTIPGTHLTCITRHVDQTGARLGACLRGSEPRDGDGAS